MADEFMNCATCKKKQPKQVRAVMHCGWLRESEWLGNEAAGPSKTKPAKWCAGYLVTLPEVLEAARALSWAERGELRELYPDGASPMARDCIDILDSERNRYERATIRMAKEGRG